jgi:glycosyltransferase involved in cell wall biosynthesis
MKKVSKTGKPAVCHISFSEFPADGRVKRYVNSLLAGGHFVAVICKSDPFNKNKESGKNLFIHRLKVQKKRGNYLSRVFEYIFFFVKASIFALYYFFKFRIRLYHTHTLPDFVSLTVLIPRILGAKVILDLHEFTPEILMLRRGVPENNWFVRLSKLTEKISVKCADELITIHEGVVKLIGSRNRREITEIINGVEENEYEGFTRINTGYFNLVYNGTINDTINLEDAILALADVKKKLSEQEFNKIRLNIYGSGPVLGMILELAMKLELGNTVIYHGKVPYSKMVEELKKMDACILPLHRIFATDMSYPIKLPEMVNMGIPVIISRLSTVLRYYPEECFFYFEGGNVKELSETILKVKSDPAAAEEKVKSARESYEKISWEKVMKPRYLGLVDKMTGRNSW